MRIKNNEAKVIIFGLINRTQQPTYHHNLQRSMANADRIQKFFDDQLVLLTSGSKPSKICSEIDKFRAWLVKHQDEVVPDGSKGKLMTILEKYNRVQGNFADYRDSVAKLFSDYLQLPEGKLTNSKNKSKVLIWLQNMADGNICEESPASPGFSSNRSSEWSVEGIDAEQHTATLLSTTDPDSWKEDMLITNIELLSRIQMLFDEGSTVVVLLDGDEKNIVAIK